MSSWKHWCKYGRKQSVGYMDNYYGKNKYSYICLICDYKMPKEEMETYQ